MGKRSEFERKPRDFYPTPDKAIAPLLPHLPINTRFVEPCAGDYCLAAFLETHGHKCVAAFDIEPQDPRVSQGNALSWEPSVDIGVESMITNLPWSRPLLHPLIDRLSARLPLWILLDADWLFTQQSAPMSKYLRKIVACGRVKWIPDSKHQAKDNVAWMLFDQTGVHTGQTEFIGRVAQ